MLMNKIYEVIGQIVLGGIVGVVIGALIGYICNIIYTL